ncbi:hypothetical protein [Nocardia sp. NBC_01388]|uniref:hypothetical protein n=1 Tax=Nocardia sp. NBC_01388 TaxID=2903596 RepID=UPI0032440499
MAVALSRRAIRALCEGLAAELGPKGTTKARPSTFVPRGRSQQQVVYNIAEGTCVRDQPVQLHAQSLVESQTSPPGRVTGREQLCDTIFAHRPMHTIARHRIRSVGALPLSRTQAIAGDRARS